MERAHIDRALDLANGDRENAAQLLGIRRSALARRLQKDRPPPS